MIIYYVLPHSKNRMYNNHHLSALTLYFWSAPTNETKKIWIYINFICGKWKRLAEKDYLHGCHGKPDVQHRKGLNSCCTVGRPTPTTDPAKVKFNKNTGSHALSLCSSLISHTHTNLQAPLYCSQRNYRILFRKSYLLLFSLTVQKFVDSNC